MKKRIFSLVIFLSSLILINTFFSLPVSGATKFPKPTSYKYINDYVGIVDKSTSEKVISIGKELEYKTKAQAVIVIIDSTNNTPIESYANELFRSWGIGEKNKDNGLLILIALNDKAWRVEVGRGLEGAIPDALSNNIMTSVLKPNFSANNYNKGISESYSIFADYIAKEYNVTLDKSLNVSLPDNVSNSNIKSYGMYAGGTILFLILLDIFLNRGRFSSTILQILFLSGFSNRHHHGGGYGGGTGGFGGFGGGSSNGGGSSGNW